MTTANECSILPIQFKKKSIIVHYEIYTKIILCIFSTEVEVEKKTKIAFKDEFFW